MLRGRGFFVFIVGMMIGQVVWAQPGPGGGPGGFPDFGGFAGAAQGAAGAVQQAPVTASADTRTNSLIVNASPEMLAQIRRIVRAIDENPARDSQVFIYKVKNGSALNMEGVANLVFTGGNGGLRGTQTSSQLQTNRNSLGTAPGGTGGRGGAAGGLGTGGLGAGGGATVTGGFAGGAGGGRGGTTFGAGTTTGTAGLLGSVSVVADPNTNMLLVTTHPENWPDVRAILDSLDRSVPQVLIKVLIAEVTHDNSFDLGTELAFLNLRSSGNGQSAGTSFNIPLVGTNATGAILQILETDFTAAIRALETAGKLDVLSRPYILASDNQLATITVGQYVPYIATSNVTAQGNIVNTPAYATVGILLDVVPHINPDGLVNLDVAPEISSITDSTVQISENFSAPIFNTRSAQTRVSVQNGQTVVIGGLMEDQKESQVSKVPFLGDIPYIGQAFRRTVNTKRKTELLIFLTPHVAARPDMLESMSDEEVGTTKLVPNAVEPGAFQQHQTGLNAGYRDIPITTQPAEPTPERIEELLRGRGRGSPPRSSD